MESGLAGDEDHILAALSSDLTKLSTSPWQWWREQMPVTRKWAYLDHAAVAPLSGPATAAMTTFAQQAAEEGFLI